MTQEGSAAREPGHTPARASAGSFVGLGDLVGLLLAGGALLFIRDRNYLLFHSLVETGFCLLAFATFAFAWISRRFENDYLLFLGSALGFVGVIALLHTYAFEGLGIFKGRSHDLPTQLRLASRYFLSAAMLVAPLFLSRRMPRRATLLAMGAISALLVALIFTGHFPTCYVEGGGPTPFKVWSEWVLAALLTVGMGGVLAQRRYFDPAVLRCLVAFQACSIGTEVMFTSSFEASATASLLGHLFALSAIYLLFRAVLETGVAQPYRLLFRQLKGALTAQQQLAERLASALRTREDFLSIAAHELKTPLTSLQLQVQLAERTLRSGQPEPERLSRALRLSSRQVRRLDELIEDLLDVTRIQQGRLSYSFEPMSLNPLVRDVLERFREQLEAVGCTLTLHEEAEVQGVWDTSRIEQVLVNFLTNAMKYAAGTPVDVRLAVQDGVAALSVSDGGPGIPRAEQASLFNPFERASSSAGKGGLGLGLFIVDQIVKAHHGAVRLESDAGQGCRITVLLPLSRPSAAAAHAGVIPLVPPGGGARAVSGASADRRSAR